MNKVKIYRNGLLTPAEYTGEVKDFADAADAARTDLSRPGRVGSLYASPTLLGVCRWIRGNSLVYNYPSLETHEITVDADTTYVYSVRAWERYSWNGKSVHDYWDSAMTLTQWLVTEGLDASEWEVLVNPADIIGTPRRVSRKRIVAAGEDRYGDLNDILKRAKVK